MNGSVKAKPICIHCPNVRPFIVEISGATSAIRVRIGDGALCINNVRVVAAVGNVNISAAGIARPVPGKLELGVRGQA